MGKLECFSFADYVKVLVSDNGDLARAAAYVDFSCSLSSISIIFLEKMCIAQLQMGGPCPDTLNEKLSNETEIKDAGVMIDPKLSWTASSYWTSPTRKATPAFHSMKRNMSIKDSCDSTLHACTG